MKFAGRRSNQFALLASLLLLATRVSLGQTASLALSSGSTAAGGTVALRLALIAPAGSKPAGVQWTFSYPSAGVTSFSATADSALASSGKDISCAGGAGLYTCLATGLNTNTIPDGNVAVVTVALAPAAGSISIGVSGALGASLAGDAIPISATGGSILVAAPVTLASVGCAANSVSSGRSTTCTVSLSVAAANGAVVVGLSSNAPLLAVPASVTIPLNSSSATFTATAGTLTSDSTATITATLNGGSATANLSLVAPVVVSSLQCQVSSLAPNASTSCTATLSKPAPAGTSIALASDKPALTVPASVAAAAGASSATFSASTGAFAADQTATMTASLNGASKALTLSLTGAAAILSNLICAPASVVPGGSGTCTVTLAAPSAAASVSLISSNRALLLPATLTIAAGAVSGTSTFTTMPALSGWAIVVASLGTVRKSAMITVKNPLSINVTSSTAGATSRSLRITISTPAPVGGTTARVESSSKHLRTPAAVTIPEGQTEAEFPIETLISDRDEVASLQVFTSDAAAVESIPIRGIRPVWLSCRENSVTSGESLVCELHLNTEAPTDRVELGISSSSAALKVPPSVTPRRGQAGVLFEVFADPLARQEIAELTVHFGRNAARQSLLILPAKSPALQVPATQTAVAGTAIRFSIGATDSMDLPLSLVASNLPAGAAFDATKGSFEWTPSNRQKGTHPIAFTATNSAGSATSGTVTIEVGPETPVLTGLVNSATGLAGPACVPGAMATLRGKWLSDSVGSALTTSGTQPDASAARIRINGTYAVVPFASPHSVDFICPAIAPGTPLEIALETGLGTSNLLQTTMQEAAPGIVTRDTSPRSQAFMQFASRSGIVGIPNDRYASQVALPGDSVILWATGIDCTGKDQLPGPSIRVGGNQVTADSVDAVTERPGFCRITMKLPETLASGEAVPVAVDVTAGSGRVFSSNTASIAVGQRF